jgi:hypothetical protein
MTEFKVLVSFLKAPSALAIPPSVAAAPAPPGQAAVHPGIHS